MRNKSSRSRVSPVLLACLVQCGSLALLIGSAQAQAVSPFERAVDGEAGSWQFFALDLPVGTIALDVVLSGGTGDADLYVRAGAQPTETEFDCAPFLVGNEEACNTPRPQMGAWQIGIHAYTEFSGATVKATWSVAPPVEPVAPGATAPTDWQTQILERHNFYRAQHCAPALVWDDEIAKSAQSWSDGCVFTHDGVAGTGFGENLAGGFPGENGGAPVDMWYNEVQQYDFAAPGFSTATGHFTQLVWRGTTRVGCGLTRCPGSIFGWPAEFGEALMYSCRYAPAGNSGMYTENVLPAAPGGVCQ
jgi:hypothetical protein